MFVGGFEFIYVRCVDRKRVALHSHAYSHHFKKFSHCYNIVEVWDISKTERPLPRIVAGMSASPAFFDPLIITFPFSFFPPLITNLSTGKLLHIRIVNIRQTVRKSNLSSDYTRMYNYHEYTIKQNFMNASRQSNIMPQSLNE